MKNYDVNDWYWFVAGDKTKLYSSAAGTYVPADDPTYLAWAEDGSMPSQIESEASLGQVIASGYPTVTRPTVQGIVDAYQQDQSNDLFQRKLIKLLFLMLNRIQVLEGKQPLTVAQAKAYVKGIM